MASKNNSLFKALSAAASKAPVKTARAPVTATNDDAPRTSRQASREGKININVWLEAGFKTSLRAIQVKQDIQIQDLVAEALNDLFAKYNVPQISEEKPRAARKRA